MNNSFPYFSLLTFVTSVRILKIRPSTSLRVPRRVKRRVVVGEKTKKRASSPDFDLAVRRLSLASF